MFTLGESVDISDATVHYLELFWIHRLYIGMSYTIRISEHSKNDFLGFLGGFLLVLSARVVIKHGDRGVTTLDDEFKF